MKTKRFKTDQIIGVLKKADGGMPFKELCRKYGMSEATLCNWKAKYSGIAVRDARQLKELEDENRRLKKLVARPGARHRDAQGAKHKKLVTPEAKRQAVKHLRERFGQSQRRLCGFEIRAELVAFLAQMGCWVFELVQFTNRPNIEEYCCTPYVLI